MTKPTEQPDKPLNYRQSLFVKYYTDGDTKGNAYKSALKAGYGKSMAVQAGTLLVGNCRLKPVIEAKTLRIEAEDGNSRENVTKAMHKAAQICLNKGDMVGFIRAQENLGKNCGWYAEDNAQQREKAELSAEAKEEAIQYAEWRLLQETKDVQRQEQTA